MRTAPYIGIFLLLAAALYSWAFAPYGYCDTDQGFMPGLAWRVLNGELPYLDFDYVRPPLSVFFHAGTLQLLPTAWEGIGVRVIFYLMMAASAFWTTRSLQQFFDYQNLGLSPAVFALLAFVFGVHNYPPMPWHTVDGIFWASLGFFLICTRSGWLWQSLGLVAMLAAAASKQAFYPMPLIGVGLIWILAEYRFDWRVLLLPVLSVGILTFGLTLFLPDFIPAMLGQIMGAGSLEDILEAGFLAYAKPLLLIVLPLIIVWQATSLYQWRWVPAGAFWLAFVGLLSLHVFVSWRNESYLGPSYGFAQAFWLLGLGVAIKGFWLNNQAYAVLLSMLGLSWCAGISWGYMTPMLYFGPILFAFLLGLREEFNFQVPRYVFGAFSIFVIWCFAMLYQYPYREAPRAETLYHLGEVFPSQQSVYTGLDVFQQNQELRQMQVKFGDRFTVLPALPAAHYLLDIQPVFRIDWAHNAEFGEAAESQSLLAALAQETDYVLLQLDKRDQWYQTERYGCLLAGAVADNWNKVLETNHFVMYQSPESKLGQ
ncbi:MAG: hypothetical protein AAFQ68_07940 [Bacteroidota bacterium]